MISLTVCLAAWVAHLRVHPVNGWRSVALVVGGALYDLILLFLTIIIITIPIFIFLPTYQCYTSRHKISELIVAASSNRDEIVERFTTQKTLSNIGSSLEIKTGGRVKSGVVTPDGVVILASEDPPAVVLLIPSIAESGLKWKCIGFPSKFMPQSCKE